MFSSPAKNNTTTTSSNEVTKANKAPEITPVGNILDNKFEVCDLIKDLSSSYEKLVGKY